MTIPYPIPSVSTRPLPSAAAWRGPLPGRAGARRRPDASNRPGELRFHAILAAAGLLPAAIDDETHHPDGYTPTVMDDSAALPAAGESPSAPDDDEPQGNEDGTPPVSDGEGTDQIKE